MAFGRLRFPFRLYFLDRFLHHLPDRFDRLGVTDPIGHRLYRIGYRLCYFGRRGLELGRFTSQTLLGRL